MLQDLPPLATEASSFPAIRNTHHLGLLWASLSIGGLLIRSFYFLFGRTPPNLPPKRHSLVWSFRSPSRQFIGRLHLSDPLAGPILRKFAPASHVFFTFCYFSLHAAAAVFLGSVLRRNSQVPKSCPSLLATIYRSASVCHLVTAFPHIRPMGPCLHHPSLHATENLAARATSLSYLASPINRLTSSF